MKTKKCLRCQHIHGESEQHECPTAEYERERDELVAAAAEWDEMNWWDENGQHIEK